MCSLVSAVSHTDFLTGSVDGRDSALILHLLTDGVFEL